MISQIHDHLPLMTALQLAGQLNYDTHAMAELLPEVGIAVKLVLKEQNDT